jgi:hypothetical protein
LGWYDVRLTRAMVVQVLLVVLVAGSVVAISPARASAASGLTARTCESIYTGDRVRRLDVCTRGYIVGDGYTSAVVEMHTYRWLAVCPNIAGFAVVSSGCWLDSRSQSITMNESYFNHIHPSGVSLNWWWGNNFISSHRCYVNSRTGPKACSVTNTVRVAFYSDEFPDVDRCGNMWYNEVYNVSWRDDRGIAHYWSFLEKDGVPLFQGWYLS